MEYIYSLKICAYTFFVTKFEYYFNQDIYEPLTSWVSSGRVRRLCSDGLCLALDVEADEILPQHVLVPATETVTVLLSTSLA